MNKTTEALKRIREVLSEPDDEETIAKIREALAEQEKQEPVAYKYKESSPETGEFVFAAPVPAKREWVDLTDDEIDSVLRSYTKTDRYKDDLRSYRAVIAAFMEKNK